MLNKITPLLMVSFFSTILVMGQANRLELNATPGVANGAILDLSNGTAGDKGFLIPRMTEAQRTSLTPVDGLQVYQVDGAEGFYFYNGTSWRPWRKPISGEVDMTAGSTVIRGEGFTVTDEDIGRDLVSFTTPYASFPVIMLTGYSIEGIPPVIPGDICQQVMSNCNTTNIRYLNVDYPVGGPYEFSSGNSLCTPQPSNLTTYKTADWTGSNVIPAGASFQVNWNVFDKTDRTGLYVDWDQSGTFDGVGETILEESTGSTLARNQNITVPAGACNGFTTVRLVVVESTETLFSCEIADSPQGETEQIEIEITGGANCTYPERQANCNIAGLTTTEFRVECSDVFGDKIEAKYAFKIIDNQ